MVISSIINTHSLGKAMSMNNATAKGLSYCYCLCCNILSAKNQLLNHLINDKHFRVDPLDLYCNPSNFPLKPDKQTSTGMHGAS